MSLVRVFPKWINTNRKVATYENPNKFTHVAFHRKGGQIKNARACEIMVLRRLEGLKELSFGVWGVTTAAGNGAIELLLTLLGGTRTHSE